MNGCFPYSRLLAGSSPPRPAAHCRLPAGGASPTAPLRRTARRLGVATGCGLGLLLGLGAPRPAQAQQDLTATSTTKVLKVGAGGYMTGLSIHPSGDPVYARSDVAGAFRWNEATQTWKQLVTSTSMPAGYGNSNADNSGRNKWSGAASIATAPSDANVVYMSFGDTSPAAAWGQGCIFKSTNRGDSWTKTGLSGFQVKPNSDAGRTQGERLAVDPANSAVVFYGTNDQGLYRTEDGGTAWSLVPTAAVPAGTDAEEGISIVLFDASGGTTTRNGQTVTKTVYAFAHGAGIFRTTDGGQSWAKINGGGPADGNYFDAEVRGGVVYVVGDGYLWKYAAGAWASLSAAGGGLYEVAVDPFDANRLFVGKGDGRTSRSLDGGINWAQIDHERVATDVPWLAYTDENWMSQGALSFDPVVAGRLWFAEGIGVWRSTDISDEKITWSSVNAGIENMVCSDIVAPPGGKPVSAFWDRPLFYHDNLDAYPSVTKPGPTFASGWDLDYVETNPQQLVAVVDDHTGSHAPVRQSGYSLDGGQTWTRFGAIADGTAPAELQYGNMAVSAGSLDNIVWLPSAKGMPHYTKDRGKTWTKVTLVGNLDGHGGGHDAYYLNKEVLESDKVVAGKFYLYHWTAGFYVSTDGGASWVLSPNGPPSSAWQGILKAVPGHAGHLFFASGYDIRQSLQHSTDGGQTWAPLANVDAAFHVALGKPLAAGGYPTIFLSGIVGGKEGIWRSTDEGATWSQLTGYPLGNFDTVRAMAGDKDIFGRVYVGYGGTSLVYIDSPGGTSTPAPADTQAPTVPTALAASTVTATGFILSWAAATDNVGVSGYEVFRDGVSLGTTTATSYSLAGLSANTAYSLTVKAKDAAGNTSAASVALSVTTSAGTPTPGGAGGTGTGLAASYFNNQTLEGTAVLSRTEAVDFDWGLAAPGTGVNADNFSVRWEGQVEAPVSGAYTFTTVSDDGIRLWVNGSQVINNWTDHGPATDNGSSVTLTAGQKYSIKLEFYENSGGAVARLQWAYPGQTTAAIPATRLYPAAPAPAADTQAPTVPTALAASTVTATGFVLSWAAATDNVGVSGYEVFRDGVSLGITASTTYALSGLSAGTAYSLTVKAKDAAGNISAASAALSVTTSAGTPAPAPSSSGELLIYGDALAANWANPQGWGATTASVATPVKVGSSALKVAVTEGWGAAYFSTAAPVSASDYPGGIKAWVNGGSLGAKLTFVVYSSTTNAYFHVDVPADTWQEVSIPWSALYQVTDVKEIRIGDGQDPNQVRPFSFYVDQLRLVGGAAAALSLKAPAPAQASAKAASKAGAPGALVGAASVFPNPLPGGVGTLRYVLEREQPVGWALYDGLGRVVRASDYVRRPAGAGEEVLDLSRLAAGAYWLHLTVGTHTTRQQLRLQ